MSDEHEGALSLQQMLDLIARAKGDEAPPIKELCDEMRVSPYAWSGYVCNAEEVVCNFCDLRHPIERTPVVPGVMEPRPTGWMTFEVLGQGFGNGFCDLCPECMLKVAASWILEHCDEEASRFTMSLSGVDLSAYVGRVVEDVLESRRGMKDAPREDDDVG